MQVEKGKASKLGLQVSGRYIRGVGLVLSSFAEKNGSAMLAARG
jgi:hypothetical protein